MMYYLNVPCDCLGCQGTASTCTESGDTGLITITTTSCMRSVSSNYTVISTNPTDPMAAIKQRAREASRACMAFIHKLYEPPSFKVLPRTPPLLPRKGLGVRKTCELGMRQQRLRAEA